MDVQRCSFLNASLIELYYEIKCFVFFNMHEILNSAEMLIIIGGRPMNLFVLIIIW